MSVISMKQLLEAGVHFGHQTRKWNPKMAPYIFTARNDIHIINLEDTAVLVDKAYDYIKEMAAAGKTILFVGTKKQAQKAIEDEAKRCGMYYINSRWLGGTLTNFKTIRSRIARLNELDHMEKVGEFNLLPKKEVIKLRAEMAKLEKNLGGIKDMDKLPDVMFVVDTKKEHLAVKEAKALNIPIVALIDTNCDPEPVDYVIPGNDDAIRAISLIAGAMANAVIEAKEGTVEGMEEVAENAEMAEAAEAAEAVEATEAVAEVVEEVKAEEVVEAPKKRTRKAAAKTEEETKTEE
ncbi:MAG: 30S ribosomal protein S2 [Clostridiales bacterium]|nr:30S ribosomal protein S2 [Clostridiales bacterium]